MVLAWGGGAGGVGECRGALCLVVVAVIAWVYLETRFVFSRDVCVVGVVAGVGV